jgi:hypothetical protein
MKNITLTIIAFMALLTFNGCKKKLKETSVPINLNFNVPFSNEKEFTDIDTQIVIETFEFETNLFEGAFAEKKSTKEKLEFATAESMELSIILPQTETFDLLKDIEVYLAADGLPDLFSSYLYNIPITGLRTIALNTTGADAREYLLKDKVKLILKIVLRSPLKKGTVISVKTGFKGRTGLL